MALPAKLSALLSEVVLKRNPEMIAIIASLQNVGLTDDQREDLRQALADELLETGLRENDEPNERGLSLEQLIDKLGHL